VEKKGTEISASWKKERDKRTEKNNAGGTKRVPRSGSERHTERKNLSMKGLRGTKIIGRTGLMKLATK